MPDRLTVRTVMDEIEVAVRQIAARHGLEFSHQRARFSMSEMTTKLTLKTVGAAEALVDFQRMQFPALAGRFGLPRDAVGKSFIFKGARYTIEGLKIDRPKYPVSCKRSDGRPFKFPALVVKNALEREAGQRLTSGLM